MSRTLRGFEEEFPYRGDRGDVSDAGIIAKEQAYGDHFGAIGDHVADSMFGRGHTSRRRRRTGRLDGYGAIASLSLDDLELDDMDDGATVS